MREELEPLNLPTYSPTNAPIPEGVVIIERLSTAQDVGPKLNRTAADVVRYLLQQGEMVTATATFSAPGEYLLRVQANDESGEGGGGFQCCWTNTYVKVTVQ